MRLRPSRSTAEACGESTYFGCCPSKLTLEQIREYQVHLARRKDISTSYYNATVTALRFLYLQTLERDWSIERLPYGRREHRLPVVLSRAEVFELWRPLHQLRRRLLLMTAYSGGLRTYELAHLRVEDLDAQQMQIRIRSYGNRAERFVPYSPTLKRLMGPYLAEHDSPWLFPFAVRRSLRNHDNSNVGIRSYSTYSSSTTTLIPSNGIKDIDGCGREASSADSL